MVQKSIGDFFRSSSSSQPKSSPPPLKKFARGDSEVSPLITPVLSSSEKPKGSKGVLQKFARGNDTSPLLINDPDRHEAFRRALGGKRRQPKTRVIKPYEQQYIDLKRQWLSSVLVVQNGYKYHIYGNDAYLAGKALGRSPFPGWRELDEGINPTDALYERFASITFPVEVLPSYVEKLVAYGLKVAVANQIETAGLKAQGDNKKGPFRREVQKLYTKGTVIEELTATSKVSGHVLAIIELANSQFGLVAVQVATGDAVYDQFQDSGLVMELETRLLHIEPSEILCVGHVNQSTAKLLETFVQKTHARVTNVNAPSPEQISTAFDTYSGIGAVLGDSEGLRQAFTSLVNYLEQFNLDRIFALPDNMRPFSLSQHMYLNGDTLNSLEIFQNQTNFQVHGSLLWVLDCTVSPFGRRQLRKWIAKPLLDRQLIFNRTEAIENIMKAETDIFVRIRSVLQKMPDLERYALQIYHGRITPRQLYWALYHFHRAATVITKPEINAAHLTSSLLAELLPEVTRTAEATEKYLRRINSVKARDGCEPRDFFVDNLTLNPDLSIVSELEEDIDELMQEFKQHVADESRRLGVALKATAVLGEEFVIGSRKADAKHIPADWIRVNTTNAEIRWRSPLCVRNKKLHQPLIEKLEAAALLVFDDFVREIANDSFELLRSSVHTLAQIDCLQALAEVSSSADYTRPDLVDGQCLEIIDGRHPMIEQLSSNTFIPNSVSMYESKSRAMIITGPNMGGKSSLVRQIALIVIMAQIGCYVPAKRVRMSLMDGIYTRMGAFDNVLRGESTFMVELKECSSILARATPKSLVILDEIGRGTSTLDGVAIAYSVLHAMIEDVGSFTLFITHYPLIAGLAAKFPKAVTNWSMDVEEENGNVTFLYTLVNRVARRSYGLNVARLAELPESVLKEAQHKSAEIESHFKTNLREAARFKRALTGDEEAVVTLLEMFNPQRGIQETQNMQ